MYVINTLNIISIPWPTAAVQRKFCIMARCPGPGACNRAQPASSGAYWSQEGTALCNSGANRARISQRIFFIYGIDLFFILFYLHHFCASPVIIFVSRFNCRRQGVWWNLNVSCTLVSLPPLLICVSLAFCFWFCCSHSTSFHRQSWQRFLCRNQSTGAARNHGWQSEKDIKESDRQAT